MFSYGFYNSLNGDRKYDAVQVSSIFDGVIEDGVYANIGEFFAVVPGASGLQVTVKTGRAWFNHTWSLNDAYLPLDLDPPDVLQTRIDAVVLEVDSRVEKRENSIKIVQGVPSVNPLKPTLLNTGGVYQHALAYVTVKPDAEAIKAEDIEIVVGKSETPFVQCPLKTVSIDDLFNQWDSEFNAWFDNVKLQMTDNVVTNLQRQIDEKVNVSDKATDDDIASKNPNKWVGADKLDKAMDKPGDIVKTDRELSEADGYLALDGHAIDYASAPSSLKKKIVNNVPPLSWHSIFTSQIGIQDVSEVGYSFLDMGILSKDVSIGEYDYIPDYNGSIYKIDRSTKKVTKKATSGNWFGNLYLGGGNFAVFGERVFMISGNSMTVFDKDLTVLKNYENIHPNISVYQWVCAARLASGRILLFYIDRNNSNYIGCVYSDNNFDTGGILSSFDENSLRKQDFGTPSFQAALPPMGSEGSMVYQASSGRLFLFPINIGRDDSDNQPSSGFYYSDDYGTIWRGKNIRSTVRDSVFKDSNGYYNLRSIGYSLYKDNIYAIITGGMNQYSNADQLQYGTKICKFSANSLELLKTVSNFTGEKNREFIAISPYMSDSIVTIPDRKGNVLIASLQWNDSSWAFMSDIAIAKWRASFKDNNNYNQTYYSYDSCRGPYLKINLDTFEFDLLPSYDSYLKAGNSYRYYVCLNGFIITAYKPRDFLTNSVSFPIDGTKDRTTFPSLSETSLGSYAGSVLEIRNIKDGLDQYPSYITTIPTTNNTGSTFVIGIIPGKDGLYFIPNAQSSHGNNGAKALPVKYLDLSKRMLPYEEGSYVKLT